MLNLPTKWYKRAEPLAVGDIVMVADETRRGARRKGRVLETIKGKKDDQVTQVRILTANGEMTRPTVKIAKVDIHGDQGGLGHGVGDVGDLNEAPN